MPSMSYRDLLAGEATCEVVYNGHRLTLTYDPGAITDNTLRDVGRLARQTEAVDVSGLVSAAEASQSSTPDAEMIATALTALDGVLSLSSLVNALLCRFLLAWELRDDDGVSMFPITPERLGDLPLAFRQAVLNALFRAGHLGEANGTTLPARSRASTSTATRAGSRR